MKVPVIASGGASTADHMIDGLKAVSIGYYCMLSCFLSIVQGADAVLAASIFHYGEYTVGEVRRSNII